MAATDKLRRVDINEIIERETGATVSTLMRHFDWHVKRRDYKEACRALIAVLGSYITTIEKLENRVQK